MIRFENLNEAEKFLQPFMDSACAQLDKAGKGMTFRDAVLSMELDDRLVYVLGTLNYQVENGGFLQWRHNSYGEVGDLVLAALKQVNGEFSLQAIDIIKRALRLDIEPEEDHWGNVNESEYDEIMDKFNDLDNEFYSFNEDVLCELADFMANKREAA